MIAVLFGSPVPIEGTSQALQISQRKAPAEKTPAALPPFDPQRALALIEKQLSFGSRAIGRPGHAEARKFLFDYLKRHADAATLQPFRFQDLPLANIIGWVCARTTRPPTPSRATPRGGTPCSGDKPPILLAAHWDTHPYASRDRDRARRRLPVPGANDGGSGTAVLLEMVRVMRSQKPPRDILIVLFDAEDYGIGDQWILGSTHFARVWTQPKPEFGILLDMVGDRDLNIHVEGYSFQKAPDVVRKIWNAAERIGAKSFRPGVKHFLIDDHLPLNDAGIPTAVVIDFDYPAWHTSRDTPDKVSARSLGEVARVVLQVLYGD